MKRKDAVLQGAPLVHKMDEAAVEAVRATALATVGLIDLRREANLSPTVGSDAWGHLAQTSAHFHAGLQSSLAFHQAMAEVQVRMGCRTVANGGGDKDEHDTVYDYPMGAAQPLRAVS